MKTNESAFNRCAFIDIGNNGSGCGSGSNSSGASMCVRDTVRKWKAFHWQFFPPAKPYDSLTIHTHPHTQSVSEGTEGKWNTQRETSSFRTLVARLFRDNRTPFKRTQFSFATDANLLGWIGAFDRRRVFLFRFIILYHLIHKQWNSSVRFGRQTNTLAHTTTNYTVSYSFTTPLYSVSSSASSWSLSLSFFHRYNTWLVSNFLLNNTTNEIVNVSRE